MPAVAIILGIAMVVIGLLRGMWQGMVEGLTVFGSSIRGLPPNTRPIDYSSTGHREPLLVLVGVAFVLIGVWAYLPS